MVEPTKPVGKMPIYDCDKKESEDDDKKLEEE